MQRIFLDSITANKTQATQAGAKISTGQILGSAGLVQLGKKGERIYFAEGPETGASLAYADPEATVLVSFSIAILPSLAGVAKHYMTTLETNQVFIAADNDGQHSGSVEGLHKAINAFKAADIHRTILWPHIEGRDLDKVDFNDVLCLLGLKALRAQMLMLEELE